MTLGSFGLMAIAETRPLFCCVSSSIGLGPRAVQTTPLRLIASAFHTGCCRRDRWLATRLHTGPLARPHLSRSVLPPPVPPPRRPARLGGEPRSPERAPLPAA